VGKPQLANPSGSTPNAALKDPPIERFNLSIYVLVLGSRRWSASCARLLISVLPVVHQETKIDQHRRLSDTNNHLASWRHSAETATNACISKVIGGRFYDATSSAFLARYLAASTITKSVSPIVAGKWSASPAKEILDQRDIDETEKRGG
jgi:hypothetical protein